MPDLGHPDAAPRRRHQRGSHGQRSRLQQLLRHRVARLREDDVGRRHRHRATTSSTGRSALRNLTRYGKNYRDAVITPPRPVTTAAGQGPTDPGYDPAASQMRRTDTKYQHRNDTVDHQPDGSDLAVQDRRLSAQRRHRRRGRARSSADLRVHRLVRERPSAGRRPAAIPTRSSRTRRPTRRPARRSNADANSAAIYAFDTVKLNEHWQVDLGVRWDHVKIDYKTVSAHRRRRPTSAAPTRRSPAAPASSTSRWKGQHLRGLQHVVHAVLRRHARADAGGNRREQPGAWRRKRPTTSRSAPSGIWLRDFSSRRRCSTSRRPTPRRLISRVRCRCSATRTSRASSSAWPARSCRGGAPTAASRSWTAR